MLEITPRLSIPSRELEFTFVRSSGPGGQKVNKTSSCAVLRWSVALSPSLSEELRNRLAEKLAHRLTIEGDLIVRSDRFRDRGQNIEDCLEKLKATLAAALFVPKKRKPTKTPRRAKEKRLKNKKLHGEKKRNRRIDA